MSYPRPPRLRRVTRGLGLALVTLAISLAGLELALRALELRPVSWPEELGRPHLRSAEGPLGWELVPGGLQRLRYPAWAGGAEREVRAHVNAHGWRGAEPVRERPALRIACAGDSFTYGSGVQDGETLPAQLAAALRADGVRGVEVLNWGVEGYDTTQEVAQLERRLPRWRPDLVVLTYFLNDANHPDAPRVPPPPRLQRLLLSACATDASAALSDLRERSWVARWACLELTFALLDGRQALMEDALYDGANPGWDAVRAGLRRARDLTRANECALLVALYPRLTRRGAGLVGDAAYARVADFCRAEGIDVVDLSPAFAGRRVEDLHVHPLDPHPDARAHALAARALADRLHALGWLTPGVARAGR